MSQKKKHPKVKAELHTRNKHRERYDFIELIMTCSELKSFVSKNAYGDFSIDFSDPKAVLMLNKALLMHYYNVKNWDIPEGYLCPPVPGRADYIHHIADLLASCNEGEMLKGDKIKCLDVGVGANCIYPIVGVAEYGWSFVGSDVEKKAIDSAANIVAQNKMLSSKVDLRLQPLARNFFRDIILEGERFDMTMCNPPFHASAKDAKDGTLRKLSSLNKKEVDDVVLNFGGKSQELYCPGGEERFVKNMIAQSKEFAKSCYWFSSLVSKKDNVRPLKVAIKKAGAVEVRTISMSQGTKISRFIAWTFLSDQEQKDWRREHW